MEWAGACALPDDQGFALISETNRGKVAGIGAGAAERFAAQPHNRTIDLVGIMLDPSGARIVLAQLCIRARPNFAVSIEHHNSSAGCPLINCQYKVRHQPSPSIRRCLDEEIYGTQGKVAMSEMGLSA